MMILYRSTCNATYVAGVCLDEEERLLTMSYNKHSPLSNPTEYELQQSPPTPTVSMPNFDDDTKYQTVLVTKDNDHLGFSIKVMLISADTDIMASCL